MRENFYLGESKGLNCYLEGRLEIWEPMVGGDMGKILHLLWKKPSLEKYTFCIIYSELQPKYALLEYDKQYGTCS